MLCVIAPGNLLWPTRWRRARAGPATPTAGPCASATGRRASTSSTATAGPSMQPGCSPTPGIGCTPRPGRAMRGFAGEVARRWSEPDAGIWEIRGDGAHHVHSKLMRWLALNPALRIAERQRTPRRQRRAWQKARDALTAEVTVKGFDASRFTYTYTCTYGSQDVDAALLILPYRGGHCPWGQLEQLQPSVRSCRCFRFCPASEPSRRK
jgi:hypothetical protein